MKLVKTKKFTLNTCIKTYIIKMISGEKHIIKIKPNLSICCYAEYEGFVCPFYVSNPEYILKNRIKNRLVVNTINYALVESFCEQESNPLEYTIYEKTYKSWFSKKIQWSEE